MEVYINEFEIINVMPDCNEYEDEEEEIGTKTEDEFIIQAFGNNEKGETCSVFIKEFKPYFYVKIPESWKDVDIERFKQRLKKRITNYFYDMITSIKLMYKCNLYGFDNKKQYPFLFIQFKNMKTFNKVKGCWYNNKLYDQTQIYEDFIPPLFRYFHITNNNPCEWIYLPLNKTQIIKNKTTICDHEFIIHYRNIIPLPNKETAPPLKVCSFDIEASSSHGKFPLPVKNYTLLAEHIADCEVKTKEELWKIVINAFGIIVYTKEKITKQEIKKCFDLWIDSKLDVSYTKSQNLLKFINEKDDDEEDENEYEDYHTDNIQINSKMSVLEFYVDKSRSKNEKVQILTSSLDKYFPKLEGDKITFIGTTFLKFGEKEPYFNHCLSFRSCNQIANTDNTVIEACLSERDLILKWTRLIRKHNPDIVIGYNIFGFDYKFMYHRAKECDCLEEFLQLSRNKNEVCLFEKFSNQLQTSGQNEMEYVKMVGRVQIDMYFYLKKVEPNLPSYTLDYTSGTYLGDSVISIKKLNNENSFIYTKNMTGLNVGTFVKFEIIKHSTDLLNKGQKYFVVNKNKEGFEIIGNDFDEYTQNQQIRWSLAKDDVSPDELFTLCNGSDEDRATIAKYCIQDCNLVQYLVNKLDIITELNEMAKLTSVPLSYLITRGQGIKLTGFMAKKCREKGVLMPSLVKKEKGEQYEGAIVIDPRCGLYLNDPIGIGDFNSLYPSSAVSERISHDSKVYTKVFDLAGNLVSEQGYKDSSGRFIYDNLPDIEYIDIPFDNFEYIDVGKKNPEKRKCGYKICRFAQIDDAILPSLLTELLTARKHMKKLEEECQDPFMKNVLKKRQLAIKLTANSVYGGCGASTSTFYEIDIASSITATGRLLLTYAKKIIEECVKDIVYQTKEDGKILVNAEHIYGDTDSVFFLPKMRDYVTNEPILDKKALKLCIEVAQYATNLVTMFLKPPHNFEYEKTFYPFFLFARKKYVGILYEKDINKGKMKSMGNPLKTRGYCPIVKDVYGGIIDILFNEKNIDKALGFLNDSIIHILSGNYDNSKLIMTTSLKSNYKKPEQIRQRVLADRIAKRDPGNAPSSGDRVSYIFIKNNEKLLGNRIETPKFIVENNLPIDYFYYINNQLLNPVGQLFGLIIEDIWKLKKKQGCIYQFKTDIQNIRTEYTNKYKDKKTEDKLEKFIQDKINDFTLKKIKELLFEPLILKYNNKQNTITNLFQKKVK
jgi:DNA polymerase elongation subunit (family B)